MIRALRATDPHLFTTGAASGALVLVFAALAVVDDAQILGISRWIKPLKFAASMLVFVWTVAWMMPELRASLRATSLIRRTIAVAMSVEVALVTLQAARGTTSHFNEATRLDGAIFSLMALFVVANTIAVVAMLVTLRRDTPPQRAGYLWGVRIGLAVFVLASLQGFAITSNRGHAVPGPDGGPGLPLVNWATDRGDLRVAHFVGLHALQALPLVGALLDRCGLSPSARSRIIGAIGVLWVAGGVALFVLATAGRPLLRVSP